MFVECGWRQTSNHVDGSPLKAMTATRWWARLAVQNSCSISCSARPLTLPPARRRWLSARDPAPAPPREQAGTCPAASTCIHPPACAFSVPAGWPAVPRWRALQHVSPSSVHHQLFPSCWAVPASAQTVCDSALWLAPLFSAGWSRPFLQREAFCAVSNSCFPVPSPSPFNPFYYRKFRHILK